MVILILSFPIGLFEWETGRGSFNSFFLTPVASASGLPPIPRCARLDALGVLPARGGQAPRNGAGDRAAGQLPRPPGPAGGGPAAPRPPGARGGGGAQG